MMKGTQKENRFHDLGFSSDDWAVSEQLSISDFMTDFKLL